VQLVHVLRERNCGVHSKSTTDDAIENAVMTRVFTREAADQGSIAHLERMAEVHGRITGKRRCKSSY